MASSRSRIDILLNLVPENAAAVLTHIASDPTLASAQDTHGYSLLHAAVSYSQLALVRALIETYHVSPNINDEDNETPLFYAETVEIAQVIVELGADVRQQNAEGQTAEEKIRDEGEFGAVAAWLAEKAGTGGVNGVNGVEDSLPPAPEGIHVNVGTMQEPEGDAPDPEFRRRIEELAARDNFQSEEGQRQLRELVVDAVGGMREDEDDGRETSRRRIGD